MPDRAGELWFRFFNEVGIVNQLAGSLLAARLPKGFLVPHFTVLNHLVRVRDGQTPLALTRAFQVPKTTMTHTLMVLERAGLVVLRPNPDDGRSKRVWLTPAGAAFRDAAIAALQPDVARLAARYPAERIAALLPALEELRRILDADRDGGGPGPAPPP
jgi:DNA-binding MarR family transcriptional regulator